jgi:hypothetical protein
MIQLEELLGKSTNIPDEYFVRARELILREM